MELADLGGSRDRLRRLRSALRWLDIAMMTKTVDRACWWVLACLWLAPSFAEAAADYPPRPYVITEQRAPCRDYQPQRQLFFGDTHVHTVFSFDAVVFGTRLTPADAYRFARGEKLGIRPYDRAGRTLRTRQLRRPLDFTALTDHGETMGKASICVTPGAPGYHHWHCYLLRWQDWLPSSVAFYLLSERIRRVGRPSAICGDDNANCEQENSRVWNQIVDAAEHAYDRSADCEFSSFVAYEWSSAPQGNNLHRNVIFRNANLGMLSSPPPDSIALKTADELMEVLERDCVEQPGCDVLTIPHNSNLSGGKMFPIGDETLDADTAARQERMQPLLEVMQHKGDSECWFGLGAEDELCAFETLPFKNFSALFRRVSDPASTPEPVTPENGFARVVLTEGLRHEARIGVNPWRLGLIAATDTHAGLPGSVAEDRFQGHTGGIHPDSDLPGAINFGPGGLTAVWAEENTRDSLFSAMRRREVYGTSGPRISLRFFGGWDYSQQLCGQGDFVRRADRGGVPMGARMKQRPAGAHNGPRFAVLAQRDPGVPGSLGTPLQRVQIIKGWVDERGERRQRVYDVAGSTDNGASVDSASCALSGTGHDRLCAVWSDTDYLPGQRAYYYARAVENPSCRWNAYACNAQGIDCSRPESVPDNFAVCCSADIPKTHQERAWSSPIWLDGAAQSR